LKELITKYDAGWKDRLAAIARFGSGRRVAFAYAVDTLKPLPPVRPSLILNAGGNLQTEHTGWHRGAATACGRAGGRRRPKQ
jgi:hypothetical protein